MCIAFPFEVIKIDNDEALVQYKGVEMMVSVSLLEDVVLGDYVLVHAGCAIEKLDKEEGKKTEELFNSILNLNL
ncbi:HypC/HybG/HupF family hydrogenase formation chaperone [Clostridium sp. YIM B02505]|uniref:HypC/HybG/HupF family hydrogenase formation chaperone n=1 Tax=Clostridium yunnanense TaxID=2800325 RepID=A0ABS1EKJ5_9CLOT|nr:HypC/HybG/HupF family hydrogenase formation chaperone [Clostridium yunnanense]MBK1809860.1 HypC/HybG/HupF family hydrogenase formation chaperone [Clostridium yunnanense]